MTMKKTLKLLLCILTMLLIGGLAGFATSTSINGWYTSINKPSFNPPNYLFGPVWTTLYILMGVSLYLILQSESSELRKKAIAIFSIQLFLNFCWSFIFFNFQMLGLAFVEIILMWICILTTIVVFFKINKTAGLIQIPYLLWVSFASVLNGSIWYLN